jgi:hypothetical protein
MALSLPVLLLALLAAGDPTPGPEAPAPQAAPAAPASIESILQNENASGQTTDVEDQPAAPAAPTAPATAPVPAPPAGTPYADIDSKAYGEAILAAARTAQAMQGPLDGGWNVAGADGKRIYAMRMVDHGQGPGAAEGAWRDLQAGPRLAGSGFISSIGYDGGKLMLRFYESGPDDLVVLTVTPSVAGAWTGELWRKGAVAKVTFSRDQISAR